MEMYFGCRWSKSLSVVTSVEFIAYSAGAIQRSFVPLRQSGVGPNKTCADATLPKGHDETTNLGAVLRKWRVMSERTLREVAAEIGIAHGTLGLT